MITSKKENQKNISLNNKTVVTVYYKKDDKELDIFKNYDKE